MTSNNNDENIGFSTSEKNIFPDKLTTSNAKNASQKRRRTRIKQSIVVYNTGPEDHTNFYNTDIHDEGTKVGTSRSIKKED